MKKLFYITTLFWVSQIIIEQTFPFLFSEPYIAWFFVVLISILVGVSFAVTLKNYFAIPQFAIKRFLLLGSFFFIFGIMLLRPIIFVVNALPASLGITSVTSIDSEKLIGLLDSEDFSVRQKGAELVYLEFGICVYYLNANDSLVKFMPNHSNKKKLAQSLNIRGRRQVLKNTLVDNALESMQILLVELLLFCTSVLFTLWYIKLLDTKKTAKQ